MQFQQHALRCVPQASQQRHYVLLRPRYAPGLFTSAVATFSVADVLIHGRGEKWQSNVAVNCQATSNYALVDIRISLHSWLRHKSFSRVIWQRGASETRAVEVGGESLCEAQVMVKSLLPIGVSGVQVNVRVNRCGVTVRRCHSASVSC